MGFAMRHHGESRTETGNGSALSSITETRHGPETDDTDIDLAALGRDRDQLWAEAVCRYEAGNAWHLAPAAAEVAATERDARQYVTELEEDVRAPG